MSPFNRQYRLPIHISQKLPIMYSVFEIWWIFCQKSQIFPPHVYLAPPFGLIIAISFRSLKTRVHSLWWGILSLFDMFSPSDKTTCDGRTDRPGHDSVVNKKSSIQWHWQDSMLRISISISVSVHFTRAPVLWYTMEANSRYSVYTKIAQWYRHNKWKCIF